LEHTHFGHEDQPWQSDLVDLLYRKGNLFLTAPPYLAAEATLPLTGSYPST
jgi:hypothetical protein